jgi:hypothetical protein
MVRALSKSFSSHHKREKNTPISQGLDLNKNTIYLISLQRNRVRSRSARGCRRRRCRDRRRPPPVRRTRRRWCLGARRRHRRRATWRRRLRHGTCSTGAPGRGWQTRRRRPLRPPSAAGCAPSLKHQLKKLQSVENLKVFAIIIEFTRASRNGHILVQFNLVKSEAIFKLMTDFTVSIVLVFNGDAKICSGQLKYTIFAGKRQRF